MKNKQKNLTYEEINMHMQQGRRARSIVFWLILKSLKESISGTKKEPKLIPHRNSLPQTLNSTCIK